MPFVKRICPACGQEKSFRTDCKTCGCEGTNPNLKPKLAEESTIKNDGSWEISLPKTRIHTLEQLVEFFEIDLSIWEVERFVANKWDMGYKDETTGKAAVKELYQVKAFLKRKQHVIDAKTEIAEIIAATKKDIPSIPVTKQKKPKTGGMLEINLIDHHFGKLAWQVETGFASYDVKIAADVFKRALTDILRQAPFEYFEEIWFTVGNDLFHVDNTAGKTTAGTQVEADVRSRKTYHKVSIIIREAIQTLRERADKVKVIVVPGNHDNNSAWHLGHELETVFANCDDVEVDNSPSVRKYHVYGNTLIGFAHGDKGKLKDLPNLMTAEAREMFGRTLFHEIHTGHLHTTRTVEIHGIRVRILSALCPPDKWHSEMGFVGNLRSTEAFYYDKKLGLRQILLYNDPDDLIEKGQL